MKLYIRGSCGERNGLYSSELALHDGHVGLTEMTIYRCSLFLRPKLVLYCAAKACNRFPIPHELPFDHFYVHHCAMASPGQSEQ